MLCQTTATQKDSLQLSIPADGGWCVRVPGSCFLICCAPGGGKLNCGINEDLLGSELGKSFHLEENGGISRPVVPMPVATFSH